MLRILLIGQKGSQDMGGCREETAIKLLANIPNDGPFCRPR